MKKIIFISILLLTTLFFAFVKPATDDRPKWVDADHWIKINDDMGLMIEMGKALKKAPDISGECNGRIMFKKDNKWYTLNYQDSKIYNKFLNSK